MNSRLDTMQAAVLLAKFPTFCSNELDRVNHVAEKYHELLKDVMGLSVPHITDRYYSSWAQYTIQLPENIDRSVVQKELRSTGIPTNIYYIKPMQSRILL